MGMTVERQAALAAYRALGTTATPDWIARVMQHAFVEDVARALVMSGSGFRDHLMSGLGPGARAAVLDELVTVLGLGISQQEIDTARVVVGDLALQVARATAGTLPQDA